jgi:hypothetical protein
MNVALASAVLTLGVAGACAPDGVASRAPLAPTDAPALARSHGKARARWHAAALTRDQPLASDVVVVRVIGPAGGTLEMRELGLRVDVPAGAVLAPTTFRVTAVAGEIIAYDFAPEGAVFTTPLVVSQSVRGTSWERLKKAQRESVEAGYFTSRALLDQATRSAQIAEVLPTTPAWSGNEIQFPLHHFSGYMYSWGRSRVPE